MTLSEKLEPFTRQVNLDYDYYDDHTEFKIYNFEVPESERNSGVGSEVMAEILQIVRNEGFEKIRVFIARTALDEPIAASEDPTVKFLTSNGFTIIAIEETVEAVQTFD